MGLLVADIGGTRARFAMAQRSEPGVELDAAKTLAVDDYPDFETACRAYLQSVAPERPTDATLALACGPAEDVVKLTNNRWIFDRAAIESAFDLQSCLFVNDFEAVAHTVANAEPDDLVSLAGSAEMGPQDVISILGPGTGLGVALLIRNGESYRVVPTEAGHIGFAPQDAFEDGLTARLRAQFGRVSAERVVAGPGLAALMETLSDDSGKQSSDAALWQAALDGHGTAGAALGRFLAAYGSFAGDIALAHGSHHVVLVGGLTERLLEQLPQSNFMDRFREKGRFASQMADTPISFLRKAEPGLTGAALAFFR